MRCMQEWQGLSMWKFLAAWFAMLLVSVANGVLRDLTYGKHIDALSAHQVSCVTGILLLGIVIKRFIRHYPPASGGQAIAIGVFWLMLTVAFEFLFFHFVSGHSWSELWGNYDVLHGRMWLFVLIWVALAPYVFFRLHRTA